MYSLEPPLPESTIMEETKRIRKSTGPDQQLDFYQQQFINTSVHVHGSPSSSLRSMAVLSSCRGSLCPRPPLLLSAPKQNRHATQATPVRLRHIPQTGRHNYDYLTLSLPSVLGFRPFFAKILAHFSAVSKLKNILEICQKMQNIQEICSRKWLRNRKSKVAEYSKILEDRPSEITRWLPASVPVLQGFPTKFLQKIEWKKVACRWRFFETVVLSVTLHDFRREADNPYHFRLRAVPQDGHASEEIERSQRK